MIFFGENKLSKKSSKMVRMYKRVFNVKVALIQLKRNKIKEKKGGEVN